MHQSQRSSVLSTKREKTVRVVSEIWENNYICRLIVLKSNRKSNIAAKRVVQKFPYERYQITRRNTEIKKIGMYKIWWRSNHKLTKTKQQLGASAWEVQQFSESNKYLSVALLYDLNFFTTVCFYISTKIVAETTIKHQRRCLRPKLIKLWEKYWLLHKCIFTVSICTILQLHMNISLLKWPINKNVYFCYQSH